MKSFCALMGGGSPKVVTTKGAINNLKFSPICQIIQTVIYVFCNIFQLCIQYMLNRTGTVSLSSLSLFL